jgi:hypothetical protein
MTKLAWLPMLPLLALAACSNSGGGPRGDAVVGDPCVETRECVPETICFNRFCVGQGRLRISLAFDADSDFDLHVETPGGREIYFANRSADGGTLDLDQCVGGCDEAGTHVENVNFAEDAPPGEYDVWVVNFNGGEAGAFEIEVAGDVQTAFSGSLDAVSGAMSEIFRFTL